MRMARHVRGLAAGLVREAAARYGVSPSDLVAAISPSIGPCCFEVGDEVIEEGCREVEGFERFVRPGPRRSHVDLWEMNRCQLVAAGVGAESIEIACACSRCLSGEHFSYRAGKGASGLGAFGIGFAASRS